MMHDCLIVKVIEAIADSKGVEPSDLDFVLADHINFDAVEQLAKHSNSRWRLEFELPNHLVTVTSDEEILVEDEHEQNRITT